MHNQLNISQANWYKKYKSISTKVDVILNVKVARSFWATLLDVELKSVLLRAHVFRLRMQLVC